MAYPLAPSINAPLPPPLSTSNGPIGRILQRLPIVTHLAMIPIVLLGPAHFPYVFATFLMAAHIFLLSVNVRSAWGAFRAWRGVAAWAKTDWRREWEQGRERKINNGTGREVLLMEQVEHVILLPNYSEDLSTLRETLDVLASHVLASSSYRIVLAMEEREQAAPGKATILISEYAGLFLDLSYTLHPPNIPGEAAGKSSNLAWASRATAIRHRKEDVNRLSRMVVTVIDSDTCFASDYFSSVACKFALASPEERTRMMFVPTICFDRNASDVPVSVRVTDIFWGLAGMSSTFPGSSAKIPTSAYGVSMLLAARVGFWDAGPEAIGEDMHMAIKCIFSTKGNVIAETIYSPASQLDVVAGKRGGLVGLWNDHKARYAQAIRHMWGCLDSGYAYRRLIFNEMGPGNSSFPLTSPDEPTPLSLDLHSATSAYHENSSDEYELSPIMSPTNSSSSPRSSLDGFQSSGSSSATSVEESPVLAATKVLPIAGAGMQTGGIAQYYELPSVKILPFLSLFARLYEAHMLMGNMFIIIAIITLSPPKIGPIVSSLGSDSFLPPVAHAAHASSVFSYFSRANSLPAAPVAAAALALCAKLRNLSLAITIFMCLMYDCYHRVVSKERWSYRLKGASPTSVSHLGLQPGDRSHRNLPFCAFDYFLIPAGIIFGIVPLIHVQIFQLWTNTLTYTVSLKPMAKPGAPNGRKMHVSPA